MNTDFSILFKPLQIGPLQLRNRIVAPPMYQGRSIISAEGVAWYKRLAAGGAGLVIVEVTGVPKFLSELTADNLRMLVGVIHTQGAAAAIQLFPTHFRQDQDLNALTAGDIEGMLDGYARAVGICRDAGFDAVEPHGAHGYLLNQFFMPDQNRRTDEYGGSLENRCRFAVQIVERIRQTVENDMLILYRHTPVGKAYGIEDSLVLASKLVDAGVDVLDISPGKDQTEADLAAPFKAKFGVPVIAVGGMENPEKASDALRAGRCDLVAVGRSLIADAHWPQKVREGRLSEIVPCEKCNEGCFGKIMRQQAVYCKTWRCDPLQDYLGPEIGG